MEALSQSVPLHENPVSGKGVSFYGQVVLNRPRKTAVMCQVHLHEAGVLITDFNTSVIRAITTCLAKCVRAKFLMATGS